MTDLHLYNKLSALPADLRKEAIDFIDFLMTKSTKTKQKTKRLAGLAKGMIEISDDFDEPLENFRDYM